MIIDPSRLVVKCAFIRKNSLKRCLGNSEMSLEIDRFQFFADISRTVRARAKILPKTDP